MAVISSPLWGVFAVTAVGPGPRRGHVICSGVFAVAAVTAAGPPAWPRSLACPASSAEASWASRSAPRRAWCCRAADGSALESGELSIQVTVVVRFVRAPRWAGALRPAGRRRGVGCRPGHRAGTGAPGQRLDTVPRWDHRLRPGTASSMARSPAGSAFSGRATPNARPPDRDDVGHDPYPQLRRRHVFAAETPIYQARFVNRFR